MGRPGPTYLSLFSGIGGLDLGLDRAGFRCVGQVERDAYCRAVLSKHWPEVPKHDDVRTAVDWWRGAVRPVVDVVAGGFPCQPVSLAGRGLAQLDERWLWPAMAAVIAALRPRWVIGENVPGLRRRGLADVLRDLARIGYRARAGRISACAVGAPHTRERLFVLAHTEGHRRREGRPGRPAGQGTYRPDVAAQGVDVPDSDRAGTEPAGPSWWATEPDVGRVAHGVPARVDRLRGLGNAVVPQAAEYIGRLVLDQFEGSVTSGA